MLKRIIIKNFRSIKFIDYKVNKNTNLHLFMGVNESGKSNILKAIDCLSKGFKNLDINSSKGNQENAYIIFECKLDDKDFSIIKHNIEKISGFKNICNSLYYLAIPDKKTELLKLNSDNKILSDNEINIVKNDYNNSINKIYLETFLVENLIPIKNETSKSICDSVNEFIDETYKILTINCKNFFNLGFSDKKKIFNNNFKKEITVATSNFEKFENKDLKIFKSFNEKINKMADANCTLIFSDEIKTIIENNIDIKTNYILFFKKFKKTWLKNFDEFEKSIKIFNHIKDISNWQNSNNSKIKYRTSYISTYANELKDVYSWQEIKENNNLIIKTLLNRANLKLEDLINVYDEKDVEKFKNLEKKINLVFKNDLDFFYSLNKITIFVRFDLEKGMSLYATNESEEDENSIINTIEKRSDGFRQFLFFTIFFGKVLNSNFLNNDFYDYEILLLDEPGFSLHPKAQKNLIHKMDEWSKKIQIFYTSHFPYMIQDNGLDKILIVSNDIKEGSKISNFPFSDFKVNNSNSKNEDPILPIMIYLGLDIETELWSKKRKICILEGISDVYYFKTFLNIVKDEEINNDSIMLIPKFGSNFPGIISYIVGLEKEYIYIVDSDSNNKIKNEISEYDLESKILDYEVILGRKACIEEIVFKTKPKNLNKKQLAFDFYNDLKINDFILEKLKSQEKWENVDFDNLKTNIEKIVKTMKETFKKKINF